MTTMEKNRNVSVRVTRVEEEAGAFTPYIAVEDQDAGYCRLTFAPTWDGMVCVTVQVQSDSDPGQWEDVTPDQEDPGFFLAPADQLAMSDAGVFTAMRREFTSSAIRMHVGCVLELPAAYVAPVQQAIQSARDEAGAKQQIGATGTT